MMTAPALSSNLNAALVVAVRQRDRGDGCRMRPRAQCAPPHRMAPSLWASLVRITDRGRDDLPPDARMASDGSPWMKLCLGHSAPDRWSPAQSRKESTTSTPLTHRPSCEVS